MFHSFARQKYTSQLLVMHAVLSSGLQLQLGMSQRILNSEFRILSRSGCVSRSAECLNHSMDSQYFQDPIFIKLFNMPLRTIAESNACMMRTIILHSMPLRHHSQRSPHALRSPCGCWKLTRHSHAALTISSSERHAQPMSSDLFAAALTARMTIPRSPADSSSDRPA